jgi:hypothetical protein
MCRRVTCGRCGKPTYAGCGAHIEQVLADVPKPERCRCREELPNETGRAADAGVVGWFKERLGL